MGYYRITAYHPEQDICAIFDSNGYFEKLWQFSSALLQKGFKIIAVGNQTKFSFGNIPAAELSAKNIYLRACGKGKPKQTDNVIELNGKRYNFI